MSKPVFEDVFRFSGRRNRKSAILFGLAQMLLLIMIALVVAFASASGGREAFVAVGAACAVPVVVSSIASWAVASQRCRDFGWTGWAILPVFIPYIGWVFGLAIYVIPGSSGENRYGPDPLGAMRYNNLASKSGPVMFGRS